MCDYLEMLILAKIETKTSGFTLTSPLFYALQLNDKDLKSIEKEVIQKAVDGLKSEGFPYIGLYS